MPITLTIMKESVALELIKTLGALATLIVTGYIAYRQGKMNKDQKEIKKNVNGNMQTMIDKLEKKRLDNNISDNSEGRV